MPTNRTSHTARHTPQYTAAGIRPRRLFQPDAPAAAGGGFYALDASPAQGGDSAATRKYCRQSRHRTPHGAKDTAGRPNGRLRAKPGASRTRRLAGAGDGNRTRTASLEGWNSTIELHPRLAGPAGRPRATAKGDGQKGSGTVLRLPFDSSLYGVQKQGKLALLARRVVGVQNALGHSAVDVLNRFLIRRGGQLLISVGKRSLVFLHRSFHSRLEHLVPKRFGVRHIDSFFRGFDIRHTSHLLLQFWNFLILPYFFSFCKR